MPEQFGWGHERESEAKVAAIQGLHQQLARKSREIAKLTAKVAEVENAQGKAGSDRGEAWLEIAARLCAGAAPISRGLLARPPWPSSVRAEQHVWLR